LLTKDSAALAGGHTLGTHCRLTGDLGLDWGLEDVSFAGLWTSKHGNFCGFKHQLNQWLF